MGYKLKDCYRFQVTSCKLIGFMGLLEFIGLLGLLGYKLHVTGCELRDLT